MKDINITEVFCEILSGLSVLILVALICDVADFRTLSKTYGFVTGKVTLAALGTIVAISYILGLVVDAVSLSIGEWFLDDLLCSASPEGAVRKVFWQKVTAHVLTYHSTQWAYYSAYRNLFLILLPGSVLAMVVTLKYCAWGWAVLVVAGMALMERFLWTAMTVLLKGYYAIITSVGQAT